MSTIDLNDVCRDLMLRAMISMAKADGNLADVEIATISAIFEQVAGVAVSESEITESASGIAGSSSALAADLKAAASDMDKPVKEAVVKAAYLVLLADGEVATGERKNLFDIAASLNMPDIHVTAILEGLDS